MVRLHSLKGYGQVRLENVARDQGVKELRNWCTDRGLNDTATRQTTTMVQALLKWSKLAQETSRSNDNGEINLTSAQMNRLAQRVEGDDDDTSNSSSESSDDSDNDTSDEEAFDDEPSVTALAARFNDIKMHTNTKATPFDGLMTPAQYKRLLEETDPHLGLRPLPDQHVEHIIAKANGGVDHAHNYVMGGQEMNRMKLDLHDYVLAATLGLERTKLAIKACKAHSTNQRKYTGPSALKLFRQGVAHFAETLLRGTRQAR